MSTPKYFENFPNIQYALEVDRAGKPKYINIKDYFHLLTVRDDVYREQTLYVPYTIQDGERPDQISYKAYDDEQFYWVVLQINNITDYYTQWPLSNNELTAFVKKKYGGDIGSTKIHHYETVETYDTSTIPNLVLPGGLTVSENFKFTYPTTPGGNVFFTSFPVGVTNYEYELRLNDIKSQIFNLDRKYIYDYNREVRNYAMNLVPSVSSFDITEASPRY